MPSHFDPSYRVFKLPTAPTWDDTKAGLLARLDALQPEHVIKVGLAKGAQEVAWVTIRRTGEDAITASGQHRPDVSSDSTTWSWAVAEESEQPATAALIAETVIEYLKTVGGFLPNKELLECGGSVRFRVTDPTSAGTNQEIRWDDYTEHRTRSQIISLLHYGHPIPFSRGFTAKHINENYPGWTWNELVELLKAADVFVGRGGSPPTCRPTMKAIHFTYPNKWAVEWLDGDITRSV